MSTENVITVTKQEESKAEEEEKKTFLEMFS